MLVLCALVSQGNSGATQESIDYLQLSLIREYGRARFRECRLSVVMLERRASAELHCTYAPRNAKGEEIPPLRAREELGAEAARQLVDLVNTSALYDGGHVGQDTTAMDGPVEVLKLSSAKGAVMLVTTGNPTFTRDQSRHTLLSVLTALEKRLRTAAEVK